MGLCVITTRMPVADLSDHQGSSALRRDLEHLSSHAGAQVLRALGVEGDEAELRSASDEFSGHCPGKAVIPFHKKLRVHLSWCVKSSFGTRFLPFSGLSPPIAEGDI
jgi:hypothetical protein